jgi:hypothetical protein
MGRTHPVSHRYIAYGEPTLWMGGVRLGVFGIANRYVLADGYLSPPSWLTVGFAAWSILLWINISTLAPFRNWHYEFFVIQHLITFFGFIIAIMIHIPVFYSRYVCQTTFLMLGSTSTSQSAFISLTVLFEPRDTCITTSAQERPL